MKAFCLEWHVKKSDAFRDFLVDPLSPRISIELTPWDGDVLPAEPKDGEAIIFCQLPPSKDVLDRADRFSITWVPMWDHAKGYEQEWWNALPKTVKVVALSNMVADRAMKAGLPVLHLQYFIDPASLDPVKWDGGRVLLYWNRTGMVGPRFLRNLCDSVSADQLLFLPVLDPSVREDCRYELPRKIGRTEVEVVGHGNRGDFLARTASANLFLAPRLHEGVGVSFLERMARGAAVLGFDSPTMNEYISSCENGYLFSTRSVPRSFEERLTGVSTPFTFSARGHDWKRIARLDFRALGERARRDHVSGRQRWETSLPAYADFVER